MKRHRRKGEIVFRLKGMPEQFFAIKAVAADQKPPMNMNDFIMECVMKNPSVMSTWKHVQGKFITRSARRNLIRVLKEVKE